MPDRPFITGQNLDSERLGWCKCADPIREPIPPWGHQCGKCGRGFEDESLAHLARERS